MLGINWTLGQSNHSISQLKSVEQEQTVIQSQRRRLETGHTLFLSRCRQTMTLPLCLQWLVFLLQSAGKTRGLFKLSRTQLPINIKKEATGSYWNLWKVCRFTGKVLEEFMFWKETKRSGEPRRAGILWASRCVKEPRRQATFLSPAFPTLKGIHSQDPHFFLCCLQHCIY